MKKLFLAALLSAAAFGAATDSLKAGKADLKSAGPLAFGPDGVLFVGDTTGAQVVALDTADRTPNNAVVKIEVAGVNQKIAAMLGTAADQILVNDLVVNPISKSIYISVARGRGPGALPVIVKVDASGKLSELSLDNIRNASVAIANAPAANNSNRQSAITDLSFVNGNVIVAGISNEEFSSNLRSIPFPFQAAERGASIEFYHGSHAQFETNSPVRTFLPFTINNQDYILAAYTCTPLVKIPVSSLKAGAKVMGTTIAELGAGNRPIDMISYKKDGHDFILMANSSRGVMKLQADKLEGYAAITKPVADKSGIPYQTMKDWTGVQQLEKVDNLTAVILSSNAGAMDLRTMLLP
ncbi:MAG: hypothetical protein ABIR70_00075 [Bryobacteraceae bacterium]